MSDVTWTLRRPNTPDTEISALGISRLVRKTRNAGVDTAEISFGALKPVFAATTMPYQTPIVILRDGVPWFSGVVTGRSPTATGASERSTITVSGPWRWLERTTYRQAGFFLLDPLAPTDNTAAVPTAAATIAPTPGLVTTLQNADGTSHVINDPTNIIYGQSIFFVPAATSSSPPPGAEFRPATSSTPPLPVAIPGTVVTSKTDPDSGQKTVAVSTGTPALAPVAPATAGATPANFVTTVQLSSHVMVGQDDAGRLVSGSDIIQSALDYCLSQFTAPPFQVGEVEPDIQVPAQELTAQTCADVIRSVLQWTRDVTTWFDYRTNPPTLNIAKRSARPVVALLSGDDPAACIVSASLEPMPEQILTGVTIEYLRTYEQNGVTTPPYQQVDQAGFDPVGPGALVISFELSGAAGTKADGSASNVGEDAPTGLAQRIFDSRNFLEWRGPITLDEEELQNRTPWPGVCVNVMGVETAWETAAIQVQAAEETIGGQTTLTLGPPDQLSPQNFLALARAARQAAPVNPTNGTTRTNGPSIVPPTLPTPPPPSPPGGGGGGGNDDDPHADEPHTDHALPAINDRFQLSPTSDVGPKQTFRYSPNPQYPGGGTSAQPPEITAPGGQVAIGAGSAGNLFATYEASTYYTNSDSYSAHQTTPDGQDIFNWDFFARRARSEQFSRITLDLSGYSKLRYKSATLIGYQSTSAADGSTVNAPAAQDVTGMLGTSASGFRVSAPVGASWVNAGGNGSSNGGVRNQSGSVTYTTLRLVAR